MTKENIRKLIEKFSISLVSPAYSYTGRRNSNYIFHSNGIKPNSIRVNNTTKEDIVIIKRHKPEIIEVLREDLPVMLPFGS